MTITDAQRDIRIYKTALCPLMNYSSDFQYLTADLVYFHCSHFLTFVERGFHLRFIVAIID